MWWCTACWAEPAASFDRNAPGAELMPAAPIVCRVGVGFQPMGLLCQIYTNRALSESITSHSRWVMWRRRSPFMAVCSSSRFAAGARTWLSSIWVTSLLRFKRGGAPAAEGGGVLGGWGVVGGGRGGARRGGGGE